MSKNITLEAKQGEQHDHKAMQFLMQYVVTLGICIGGFGNTCGIIKIGVIHENMVSDRSLLADATLVEFTCDLSLCCS